MLSNRSPPTVIDESEPIGGTQNHILAKRNNKVHTNIGFDRPPKARLASMFDTGAGATIIRKRKLPSASWPRIQSIQHSNQVRDGNNRQGNICGVIDLFVDIGGRCKIKTLLTLKP